MKGKQYDAVVVGGGPAGATVAALLAGKGHRVLVLERTKFPRYHVGESLISGIVPVLQELGLADEMDTRFSIKPGIHLVWGKERELWRTPFSLAGPFDHSWHVDRPEFDVLILDRARELGAEVLEEAEFISILQDEERVSGVRYIRNGTEHEAMASFVIDASGQTRAVCRKLTSVDRNDVLRNIATWGYFSSYKPLPYPGDLLVEALPDGGWLWGIPLAGGRLSLGHVIPVDTMAELAAAGRKQEQIFADAVAASQHLKASIESSEREGKLRTARDWSYVCESFFGPGWVAVGDAAAFADPLFSSGVWLGMSAAWLAARAIDAALVEPASGDQALQRFAGVYRQLYTDILAYVRFFYDPTRRKEEYWERAQELTKLFAENSQVGFVSLISGVTALPEIINFNPIGMEDLAAQARDLYNGEPEPRDA